MTAKISIIMPVYNAQEFLESAVNSVINQTYENIELICVNDGSTDKSLEILNGFDDSRIKVISQKNTGISGARNTGLKHACGEYLMFIDNDDYYEPDMCECMLMAIEGVDLAVCDVNGIAAAEECSRKPEHYNQKKFGLIEIRPQTIKDINIFIWNKMFKKELCDRYSITFPDGYMHEDFCFCYKYLSVVKKAFAIDKKLYNHAIRADSAIGTVLKKFDTWYTLMNVLEFLRKNDLIHAHIKDFYEVIIKHSKWNWKFLNEDDKDCAIELIMQLFNQDELALLNSRLPFINALKTRNKALIRDLFDNNTEALTHKVINVLGLKFKIREAVKA